MDEGNTAEDQQDAGVDSTVVIDSVDVDTKDDAATVSALTPVSPRQSAVDIDEIPFTFKDEIKVETSIGNLSQEENVTSIPNSTSEDSVTQNKIAEADSSEVEIETMKPETPSESVIKEESSQETAVSGNTDPEVGATSGKNIEGSADAETIKNAAVTATIECQNDLKTTLDGDSGEKEVEVLATVKDLQESAVTVEKATHEEASAKTANKVVTATVDEGAVAKTIENPADGEEFSSTLEISISSSADENTPAGLSLLASDHEQCPVSPPSEKEVDQSDDNPLHIDECCGSRSEDAAGTAHTSSATEPVATGDDKESSMLCDKTGEILKDPGKRKEAVSKEDAAVDKPTTASKTSCSIEDSIERCIANHMSECAENDAPSVSVPKKRCATTPAKSLESEKFPRNYGFKIITNKINLCSSKPALTIMPKLDASGIPLKKIKIKAKPIAESILITKDKEEKNSELGSNALPRGVTIAVRKSTDESEPSPPKERPTLGLKVRNVESINAGIRTVKAPVCPVLPEEVYKTVDAASNVNDNLPEQEVTNPVTETPPEAESLQAAKKLGRLIAPKCEPIASNDQQAVKLIRDLIQLSSVPVYVPDVSDSQHFNGRLHLCHGCGDRFVLMKSLLEHQNRRSCIIKFQCLKCDSNVLRFFNRCEFIRHLYNHNQTLTNVMLQYHILVERLPACNTGIFDAAACPECKAVLKVPLSDHMQALDVAEKKTPDLVLKCQWCSLLLPTKCAYQAHRRMHFLQAPHVCPECGETNADLPSYNIHINSICFHTSKRSLFESVCPQCQVEMYDATKLERHIRHKHIRDVFKCNFCFVACFNMKDLHKHRRQHHEEEVVEEDDDDEAGLKYAFHLCDMCPNRLIRRVRLGQHVWDHAYTNNEVTYVYECRKCKVGFYSRDTLSGHSGVCTAPATPANAPAFATVIANGGGDIVVEQPSCTSSGVFVVEGPPAGFDSNELESEDVVRIEDDEPRIAEDEEDEREAPPPLKKAPVTLKVTQSAGQPSAPAVKPPSQPIPQSPVPTGAPPKVRIVSKSILQISGKPVEATSGAPEKKKKATPKKSPAKPEVATPQATTVIRDDNSFNSFESELFMDADDPDAGEGGMEVVLNCLECGTNLTSELGSYCTLCEQKREAGSQTFKTAALANSLPGPAKKKVPKKFPISGGNFTCRICNDLISRTCDRAAIKRHFITKHKEIFIAALQSGMNANPNGPKLSRPNILSNKQRGDSSSPPKNGPAVTKVTKKKKKAKKPPGGHVSQSDTDDSLVSTSPSKEGKKARDKRKKTYSPTFPALEEGMVASEDKGTENRENMRYCYKCTFKSADKDEFMTHVATHRSNPKDLQCPACGMGFVVRPSLEKHLVILHGMKNVYAYLLEHGFPPVEKSSEDGDTEMLEINQCRVCHSKFDSEAMLEKHFRTHGSAFLLSKQFRRS